MQFETQGKYIKINTQGETLDYNMLMNYKQKRGDPYVYVEDNLVNRLVLGVGCGDIWTTHPVSSWDTTGLKDFQIADVRNMLGLQHVLNANPMGLGKTVETIKYLEALQATNILIVCPKIIRAQWQSQLSTWAHIEAQVYEKQQSLSSSNVWIVNYEKLRNETIRGKFEHYKWDALVLDEAHAIKNRNSAQTKAVKKLKATHRVALTGTPILRYADDLWSILHFLSPFYSGGSYWSFRNYFCETKYTPWGEQISGLTRDPHKVEILNKLLQLVSVRNEAVQVAHGKTSEIVKLHMTSKQKELYTKEKELMIDALPENLTIANGAVLTIRLRQTTSYPGLFLGEDEHGVKFEWVAETCKNNPDEKFVVFSTFADAAHALAKYLNKLGINCVTITGKQSANDNAQSFKQFQEDKVQVLVGTIGAMGKGFDGLQQHSRLMIFLDRDWSPEIMKQAEDRLNRMGQKYPVHIYYLECVGTFDRYVGHVTEMRAQDIKEALKNESID